MLHLFKTFYHDRRRASYSLRRYKAYFGKSVLDVGAGASPDIFRPALGDAYKAVDFSETRHKPDFFVDLETGKLPFKDGEYETVLCFDNLEHLEKCHEMFDELLRVSGKYVIISLPNNWPLYFHSFLRGHNYTHQLGYGLPAHKPSPGVRHKWFFNLEEASNFLTVRSAMNKAKVRELDYVYERSGFNLISVPLLYPGLYKLSPTLVERFYHLDEEDRKKFGSKIIMVNKVLKTLGLPVSVALLHLVRLISLPFWLLDEVIKHAIWGWGSKFRYLNIFCRQIWIVIEK